MRNISIYISFFLAIIYLFFCSCSGHPSANSALVEADSLMESRPDSALSVLESVDAGMLETEEQRAYYALLLTQAKYRNYVSLADDTLIDSAVDYYETADNRIMAAKSYYYKGCALCDKGEYAAAIEFLHKAKREAEEEDDYMLTARIRCCMGYIYQIQGMTEKSESIYEAVRQAAVAHQDTVQMAESFSRLGLINSEKETEEGYILAESQLLEAYVLSSEKGLTQIYRNTVSSLANLYSRIGRLDRALQYAKEDVLLNMDDVQKQEVSYLILGNIYKKLEYDDSASCCLRKCLDSTEPEIKSQSAIILAEIMERNGELAEAVRLKDEYIKTREKAAANRQDTEIILTEKEMETDGALQDIQNRQYIWGAVFVSLLLVTGIFATWRKRRSRKGKEGQGAPQSVGCEEAAPVRYDPEALKEAVKHHGFFMKIQRVIASFKSGSEYKEHFNDGDRREMLEAVDSVLKNYTTNLKFTYPALTDDDVFFCCIHLLGLSVSDISILTERHRDTIYKRERKLMSEKMNAVADSSFIEAISNVKQHPVC